MDEMTDRQYNFLDGAFWGAFCGMVAAVLAQACCDA